MKLLHYLLAGSILISAFTSCKQEQDPIRPVDPGADDSANAFFLSVGVERARKVNLTWDAAEGNPTTYHILRALSKNIADDPQSLPFEKVGETKQTSFSDLTTTPKSVYFYKVKAVYSANKATESNYAFGNTPDLSSDDVMYETYEKLATATKGKLYEADNATVLPGVISNIIQENAGGANADIILLMDNTGSMGDEIDAVKQAYNKLIDALPASARLGAGGFRDRGDLYILRFQDLTTDFSVVRNFINAMKASGGGDLPEAMYDAIYGSVTQATWVNKKRIVIVVSDAPPQEGKNTDHSYNDVVTKCQQVGVEVNLYPILVANRYESGNG